MNRKPVPLSEFALLSDLEPTFEERLARLEKAVGPHPLFKPINIESDSEDDEPALPVRKDVEREDGRLAGQKRVRDGQGQAQDARKEAEKAIEALEPPKKRQATTSSRQPASKPVPPVQPTKPPRPELTEVLVLDELSDGPVASTSKLPTAAPTKTRSPPVTSSPSTSPPVVDVLSSDSDSDGCAKGSKAVNARVSKVRGIGKAIAPRASRSNAFEVPLVAGQAGAASARTRKKPRLSLEQALTEARKIKGDKLAEQFKTVSDFIDYLEQFSPQLADSKKILAGCRIVFVNTDHWRRSSQTVVVRAAASTAPRNRFDQALRTNMSVAAKNGATLVRPEDFVPPPYEVTGEPFDLERAEAEGWTTHIIPLVPQGQRAPTYKEIIACLGPDSSGINDDELGPFVQVVGFPWITKCIDVKGKASEWPYVLKGDFRQSEAEAEKEEKVRQVVKERERARKKQAKLEAAKKKKLGAKGKGQEQEDTDVEESDGSDGHADGVSPLGPEDWPEGEAPPAGYFDQATSQSTLSSLPPRQKKAKTPTTAQVGGGGSLEQEDVEMSDPIEDADLTRKMAGPSSSPAAQESPKGRGKAKAKAKVAKRAVPKGLEDELAMVDKYGLDDIDEFLEKGTIDPSPVSFDDDECMILSNRVDSFSTEEENSDEEKEEFNPRKRVQRNYRYACDNPEENRATRNGPNEPVAFQLEKLADLQSTTTEKDQFRQRSYKQAANKLRSCPTKVTRFDQLVKLRGIGDKMANKIIEILRTGTHRRLTTFQTEREKTVKLFCGIYGVGQAKAADLYDRGARSVEMIRRDPARFGADLLHVGLKYYEDLLERIPRDEVTELYGHAKRIAYNIDPKLQVWCMGSYRRGAETCGDIDLIVTRDPSDGKTHEGAVQKLWKGLVAEKMVRHELTVPEDWRSLDALVHDLIRLPKPGAKMRRIDVLGVPFDEIPAAMIYFTGNDYFNRSIRLKARRHGYRLNQRGLYKDVARDRKGDKLTEGVPVPGIKHERDIFRILKVPYCEPEQRLP
ncbi:hypothetical protein NBRC10512_001922 [Rhodotorula toruloides]|uniref:DNA polymerase beta n=2 Tax=Rhodotorula toruloides TaxID=5286 RepID=A0A061AM73_RHOTO|nr:DNA polymerase lambda subunit [Rhodotorula toruloides NP11]EMS26151.1 DNA polymerase lambda subunit [Rhodotorula toruloides NP11]CDR38699.1 RHTO0S03e12332g1_1 [Rhodotorula toruloides]